jgi:hypothetical protein
MLRIRTIAILAAVGALLAAPVAGAQKEPPSPKAETYLCPDVSDGEAIDCFLNAVQHLYTMCRQVKSIEIIEFGYEKADEGVNGAKSEYCIDKHKLSIARPYKAALREARGSRGVAESLRELYDSWLKSLADLKWHPGETDEQYKARIALPYRVFSEQVIAVRVAQAQEPAKPAAKATRAAKPKAKAKAKPTPVAAKSQN